MSQSLDPIDYRPFPPVRRDAVNVDPRILAVHNQKIIAAVAVYVRSQHTYRAPPLLDNTQTMPTVKRLSIGTIGLFDGDRIGTVGGAADTKCQQASKQACGEETSQRMGRMNHHIPIRENDGAVRRGSTVGQSGPRGGKSC